VFHIESLNAMDTCLRRYDRKPRSLWRESEAAPETHDTRNNSAEALPEANGKGEPSFPQYNLNGIGGLSFDVFQAFANGIQLSLKRVRLLL
jgi:hypothetical protein